jgi:pimeloyl-ACP methyl ester carboxylesterase
MPNYATECLRTHESRFANLPGFAFSPSYTEALPSFPEMRMAYIDAAPIGIANGKTALCLHGEPSWSFLYRKMIPPLQAAGYRVLAPDLFGFGRSDKPSKESWFTFDTHRTSLIEFVEHLDLSSVLLLVQDWGGLLGLTLPVHAPQRYEELLVMNTTLGTGDIQLSQGFKDWRAYMAAQSSFDCSKLFLRSCPHLTVQEIKAYNAPFENPASLAGVRRFPQLVPEFIDSPGAGISRAAREFWRHEWKGKSFMAVGAKDPVLGPVVMEGLRQQILGCPEPMLIAEGGHFLQEWQSAEQPIIQTALASWEQM